MTSGLICYGLAIGGGLILLAAPLVRRWRNREGWLRRAWIFAAIACLLYGGLGLVLLRWPEIIPVNLLISAYNLQKGFGGAAAGLVIFLLCSKEFWRRP